MIFLIEKICIWEVFKILKKNNKNAIIELRKASNAAGMYLFLNYLNIENKQAMIMVKLKQYDIISPYAYSLDILIIRYYNYDLFLRKVIQKIRKKANTRSFPSLSLSIFVFSISVASSNQCTSFLSECFNE